MVTPDDGVSMVMPVAEDSKWARSRLMRGKEVGRELKADVSSVDEVGVADTDEEVALPFSNAEPAEVDILRFSGTKPEASWELHLSQLAGQDPGSCFTLSANDLTCSRNSN